MIQNILFLYTVLYTHLICLYLASHFSAIVACQDSFGMVKPPTFFVCLFSGIVGRTNFPIPHGFHFRHFIRCKDLNPSTCSYNVIVFKGSKHSFTKFT